MDLTACFSSIVSAIGAIGVAYIGLMQYREKKVAAIRNADYEEKDRIRTEGILIQMEMSQASLKLAQVTAKAMTNQHLNGDVEEAMTWAKEVEVKYCKFLRRLGGQAM